MGTLEIVLVLDTSNRILPNGTREHANSTHNLLAEVITNLQSLATVAGVGDDGRVSIHQARLALELMIDTIEQVADVAADIANHGELICRGEERASLHFLVRVCNP